MPIDFDTRKVTFSQSTGGPHTQNVSFSFPTTVRRAVAAISGYDVGFFHGDGQRFDKLIHRIIVDSDLLPKSAPSNSVDVKVVLGFRDASGNYDDRYGGHIDVIVIVDRD